jgi:hypothetical protein
VQSKKAYTINEHYVPRFYLSNFCIEGNSGITYSIEATDRYAKIKPHSIESLCSFNNMYESPVGEDYFWRNKAEEELSIQEQKQERLINKIKGKVSDRSTFGKSLVLSEDEKDSFFSFIAIMFLRNKSIYTKLYYTALEQIEYFKNTPLDEAAKAAARQATNALILPVGYIDNELAGKFHDWFASWIKEMSFIFIYSQKYFVTSNMPISILKHKKGDTVEIWFPLTSHVGAAFISNKYPQTNLIVDATEKTDELNVRMCHSPSLVSSESVQLICANKETLNLAYNKLYI